MAENGPFDVDNAVRQVLCGDMEFYSAIVRQFQGDVWRLLAPLLYDREATRDMVQETFVGMKDENKGARQRRTVKRLYGRKLSEAAALLYGVFLMPRISISKVWFQ